MSTPELNTAVLEAAAAAGYNAAVAMTYPLASGYTWENLLHEDREKNITVTGVAIAHYLEHRPEPEQFRDAARILRSGCDPAVQDSRWSPSELEAHAAALELQAEHDELVADITELMFADEDTYESKVRRLLREFTVTRRGA